MHTQATIFTKGRLEGRHYTICAKLLCGDNRINTMVCANIEKDGPGLEVPPQEPQISEIVTAIVEKTSESHRNGELGMTTKTGFHRSMTSSSERAQERTVSLPGPCGRKIERSKPFLPRASAESSRCGVRVSFPMRRASDSQREYSWRLPNSLDERRATSIRRSKKAACNPHTALQSLMTY